MKYRIVPDRFAGYEVQVKRWWWPFWIQPGAYDFCINTFYTRAQAELWVKLNYNKGRKL